MIPAISLFFFLCGMMSDGPVDKVSIGTTFFSPQAHDMKDAYGLIPVFSIGVDLPVGSDKSAFLTVEGVHESGTFREDVVYYPPVDAYHTRLKAVSLVFGGRLRSVDRGRSLSIGVGVVLAWAGEAIPEADAAGRIRYKNHTGRSVGAMADGEFDYLVTSNLSLGVRARFQLLSFGIRYRPEQGEWRHYVLDFSGASVGPYLAYHLR
ncbi:hypothetical protein AMJ40_03130 [candidate division TA06 bacterium DG_26]|uniref:Outer membrane protein beta-barrel domain-containing protein n=1 Tax=candidate division TA06 bacterium DG_26 TaxID=1703771 RepID=A0A0S7WK15_UNCT6|nr:MAG: hypothetical protein AMJ40_03130 [candidate division TA06 bacterium DG_26]